MTWLGIVLLLALLGACGALVLIGWALLKSAEQEPPTPGPRDPEVK